MPAGDMLTLPGQVEWAGFLFDRGPWSSNYWISGDTEGAETWVLDYEADDLRTEVGAAQGFPTPQPMYPMLTGLCVETSAAVNALKASMVPTMTPSPLCWYEHGTGLRLCADAVPRRFHIQTGAEVSELPHFLVNVMWFVGRPLDIEELDES